MVETVKSPTRLEPRMARQIKATIMNILSWTVETWRFAFELVSIMAGALTAAATIVTVASLIGMLLTGREIGKRQAIENHEKAVRILALEKEAADAKRELLETRNRLEWREFSDDKFRKALQGATAKRKVQIVYKKDNDEAYMLASRIWHGLISCGWDAETAVPSKDDPESSMPFALREGGVIASNTRILTIVVPPSVGIDDKAVLVLIKALED